MVSTKPSGKRRKKLNDTVKTKTRGVLFDLDGVLVDAPQWHREAFDEALKVVSCAPLTEDEYEKVFNGLSTKKKLEILASQGRVARDQIAGIAELKQNFTTDLIMKNCKPIERIKDVVFWLYLNGFKTGVVTNCSKLSCHLMLKLSGLIGCWHTCITNEDVDGFIKPHPAPYFVGVRETCYSPELAMAIDDSHHGIASARAAHIGKIWHLTKFSDLTLKNLRTRLEG